MRIISPECHNHNHFDCPVNRIGIKCECICHKITGE